mgnify:CR=1 FL=1
MGSRGRPAWPELRRERWQRTEAYLPSCLRQVPQPRLLTRDRPSTVARLQVVEMGKAVAARRLSQPISLVILAAEDAFEEIENRELERLAVEQCLSQLVVDSRRLLLSVYRPGDSVKRIARENGEKSRRLYSKMSMLGKEWLSSVERRLRS